MTPTKTNKCNETKKIWAQSTHKTQTDLHVAEIDFIAKHENVHELPHILFLLVAAEIGGCGEFSSNIRQLFYDALRLGFFVRPTWREKEA